MQDAGSQGEVVNAEQSIENGDDRAGEEVALPGDDSKKQPRPYQSDSEVWRKVMKATRSGTY